MANYFLYVRKSTDREDKQVLSIDSQINAMRAVAQREGVNITQTFIEKMTAKKPGRPIFNDMISRIEKGEASGVLCWKLHRLARNPVDDGKVKWLLQNKIISKIITLEGTYSPDDNTLIAAIEFGMATQYVRDLSKDTKFGLEEKVRQGWYPALAPVGYLNDVRTKTIIINKAIAKIIRAAFELYALGNSRLEDIALFLFNHGIRTRKTKRQGHKGDLPYSKTKTSYILSNPFYYGQFRYAGQLYEGQHKPIISKQLYDKVQEVLKGRSRPQKPKKQGLPLCGLIRCGECGCMITAEDKVKHQKNGNTHRYIYYRCTKKSKTVKCLQPCIRGEELERQLTNALKDYVMPTDWAGKLLNMAEAEDKEAAQSVVAVAQDLRSKTADIDRKLERLFQGYVSEILEPEQYQQEQYKLKSEKRTLTEQIARLEQRHIVWLEPLKQWIKDAEKLGEITLSPDLTPKKSFAQKIFGLNLFLKNRSLSFSPTTQWAALGAAQKKFPETELSLILVGRIGFEPMKA